MPETQRTLPPLKGEKGLERKTRQLERDAERVGDIIRREVEEGQTRVIPTRFRRGPLRALEIVSGKTVYPDEVYAQVRQNFQQAGIPISFEVYGYNHDGGPVSRRFSISEVYADIMVITRNGDREFIHPETLEQDDPGRKA